MSRRSKSKKRLGTAAREGDVLQRLDEVFTVEALAGLVPPATDGRTRSASRAREGGNGTADPKRTDANADGDGDDASSTTTNKSGTTNRSSSTRTNKSSKPGDGTTNVGDQRQMTNKRSQTSGTKKATRFTQTQLSGPVRLREDDDQEPRARQQPGAEVTEDHHALIDVITQTTTALRTTGTVPARDAWLCRHLTSSVIKMLQATELWYFTGGGDLARAIRSLLKLFGKAQSAEETKRELLEWWDGFGEALHDMRSVGVLPHVMYDAEHGPHRGRWPTARRPQVDPRRAVPTLAGG